MPEKFIKVVLGFFNFSFITIAPKPQEFADICILLLCPTMLEDTTQCGVPEVNIVPKGSEQVAKYKYTVPWRDGGNSRPLCLQTEGN